MSRTQSTISRSLAIAGTFIDQPVKTTRELEAYSLLVNDSTIQDQRDGTIAIPLLLSNSITAQPLTTTTTTAAASPTTIAAPQALVTSQAQATNQAQVTTQAAITQATTVTLLNAAPVTQNPDGSTSVFGPQGNAIETITATGTTVLAAPSAVPAKTTIPVWYSPENQANYFADILNYPNIFSTVSGGITVFKMYGQMTALPDATLKSFFAFLTQNNIKLAIEAGPLVAGAGQSGYGIESFAGPGDLVSMLTRLKSLGAPLSYIGWDEPLWYGSITTGIYTVSQVATQVALAATAAKAIFPNVQIGDIEPVGEATISAAALQTWFTDYAAASGTPFNSFQADIATWTPGWEAALASVIATAHADNITVGAIVNGLDATVATNDGWATQADANAQLILSDPLLRPDFVVVQSWQSYPSEVGDPTIAGTLPSVAADVAASEPAALAVAAVAQYSTAGLLLTVTWTGGATASHTGGNFQVLSPTGATVLQTAWSNVQNFSFNPNTATASLTDLVLTSAAGATPVWTSQTSSIGVGANGIGLTTPVASSSTLTIGLTAASQTGFTGSGITNLTKPVLNGTAPVNAIVALNVDGVSAGSATASSTGSWSFMLPTALADGAHVVQAAVTSSATGVTTQQYVVSVDTATPTASTLVLADGSDSGYPGDDITDVAQPLLQGVADPATEISLAIDGKGVGTVETNLAGQWTYALNSALTLGTHAITATAINAAGTAAAPATLEVTIDTAAAEAAVISYDPLFDTAWYLLNNPAVAASGVNPYTQFNATGWMTGASPSPYFSTNYYINTYADVLAAHISPLWHFENYGWLEGRNASPTENTLALEKSLAVPAGQDPIALYIQTFEYADAVYTAVPNATLSVALAHDTGTSSTDDVTNDPTLEIAADPGATVTVALGTATPTTLTLGSTGSWSYAYAAASLADGSYTVTVTQTPLGGTTSTTATLSFTLDRTAPTVTAVTGDPTGPVTLGTGNVETITLNFSTEVDVNGLPTIGLNDGGVAQYTSGSGTKALTFTYIVAAGQNTAALAVTAVNLPAGASISDTAGNAANLTGADIALAGGVGAGPVVIGTQLPAVGPNVSLASGASVTATQSVNGYNVALQGTTAATASTISATSAVLGSKFSVSVTGAGSAPQYGSLVATGSNENDGSITTQQGSAGGSATLAISMSNGPMSSGATSGESGTGQTVTVPGVWNNMGTIGAEPGSTIDITGTAGASLVNFGNLISNGMMFIATPVTGTGQITVGTISAAATPSTTGTLQIQDAVAATQTIAMKAGTLVIDDLGGFLATVTNFNAADKIVFKGLNVTTAAWSNDILSLNGGTAGSFHLEPATNLDFTASSIVLGHVNGATILTIGAAAALLH